MDVDLNDYIAGGYFIAKYSDHGFWHSELLPERVISLSSCIGEKLDVVWGWDIEKYNHKEEASNFGISADKIDVFCKWCSGKEPGALYSLDIAREFVAEFLQDESDYLLIGIALLKDLVDEFLNENKQMVYDPNNQVDKEDFYGINYVLKEGKSLPPGGNMLGFEIVSSYGYGYFAHSVLCSGLERDVYKLFGIHMNQFGLIGTYTDAKKVYDWMVAEEQGEPEPYHPWLLVQYPVV